MITVNEAIEIIKQNSPREIVKTVSLESSLNCVLAEDITSPEPSPRFTNSAMDGYAIKYEDTLQFDEFKILGESQAGVPYSENIGNGEAIQINTGGMLPNDVDTVVPVEDVEVIENKLVINNPVKKNQHVRYAGEEFEKDTVLLNKSTVLQPQHIALIASVGISKVKVFDKPKVSIVVTGTELVSLGSQAEPHQIWDSNKVMLSTSVENSGGEVLFISSVQDDYELTKSTIKQAVEKSNIIITSGGVSVGPHDFVKDAINELGFETLFWKVKQKPGKPFFAAKRENKLFLGLPGNPVSAFMGYVHYIHPLIKKLLGLDYKWQFMKAKVTEDIINSGNRTQMIRVKLENKFSELPIIKRLDKQGSHMLTSVAQADGYIIVPENTKIVKGSTIDVYLFPRSN